MIWIKNSDVQIFQIYGHTTRIPDFRVNGPSENRLKSDMSDSPNFYISEIRGDRFTDFCVHTARLSGNRLQNVGRLEKIGQWDHGINWCWHKHTTRNLEKHNLIPNATYVKEPVEYFQNFTMSDGTVLNPLDIFYTDPDTNAMPFSFMFQIVMINCLLRSTSKSPRTNHGI